MDNFSHKVVLYFPKLFLSCVHFVVIFLSKILNYSVSV